MIDLEHELSRMLDDRAAAVDVHPDLDAARRATVVVRIASTAPSPRRPARVLAGVGVAAALVVALVGLVLLRQDDPTTRTAAGGAEPAVGVAIYPVLGDLPPGFVASPDASFAVPDPTNPPGVAALVGRRGPGRWTVVSRVTAMAEKPPQITDKTDMVTLGGITAARFVNDDGSAHYSWQDNGVWVSVTTRLPDPTKLMLAVRVDADPQSGPPRLSFESLPPGFAILAGATDVSTTPSPMVLAVEDPTLGNSQGRIVSVEVSAGGVADAIGAGGVADAIGAAEAVDLIEIDGARALVTTAGGRTSVLWTVGVNHTASLDTFRLPVDETIDLARAVTFVDEAQWREIYKVGPGMPSVSTTTLVVAPTPTDCPTGTDGPSGVTTTVPGCP